MPFGRHRFRPKTLTTPGIAGSIVPLVGVVLGVGLIAVAQVTTGGVALGPDTDVEIVLLALGAGAAILLMLAAPAARLGSSKATVAFVLFAGVGLLTALSVAWSVLPDQSWVEAGRTAAYVSAFGVALTLARLRPAWWPALLGAVAIATVALTGEAAVVKVFALGTDGQPASGRLLVPFGYWNATGLLAALGLAPLLWSASRRETSLALRGASVSGMALCMSVVVLSASRSATVAGVLALIVVVSVGRSRVRTVPMLALGLAGAAIISAVALGDHSLTADGVARAARLPAGHRLGVVLLAVLVPVAPLGSLLAGLIDGMPPRAALRRRVELVLAGLLAFVPVVGLAALALSSRGFTGEISHIWSSLTSTHGGVSDSPSRLTDASSSRPAYWRQGLSVGVHHLLAGAGAGSFGIAHLRYHTALLTTYGGQVQDAQHAHSYIIETFADFGVIGVVLNAALLGAWARAALLSVRQAASREREGLLALTGVVLAFGVSSAIDWTWFFPGLAVPALACAGWLAGRGRSRSVAASVPDRDGTGVGAPAADPSLAPKARPQPLQARPAAILAVTVVVAVSAVAGWFIWRPLGSEDADGAAVEALSHLNGRAALSDARTAVSDEPVSLSALQELSAIDQALGNDTAARAALVQATHVQPGSPAAWSALGQFDLRMRRPGPAAAALRRAVTLDVADDSDRQLLARAESRLHHPS